MSTRHKKFLINLSVFLLLFYGCSDKPISEKRKAINAYKEKQKRQYVRDSQETLLADVSNVPAKLFFDSLVISPDGRKVAYVSYDASEDVFCANVNDQRYSPYPVIMPTIQFSSNSKNVVYEAGIRRGEDRDLFVVKNRDIISKTYPDEDMAGVCVFSPDSKNIAYTVKEDGQWKVIVDGWGVEYPAFDSTLSDTIMFSPDSKTLIYGARKGNQHFIVVNGVPQKFYKGIGAVILNNDSLAYAAGNDSGQLVVLDSEEQRTYDFIGHIGLKFSQNGKHLAYGVEEDGKQFVILDEVEQKKYDSIAAGPLIFSPNEEHLAYVVTNQAEGFVVLDEKELKHYPIIGFAGDDGQLMGSIIDKSLTFSFDSQHFAYGVGTQLSQFMVLDGVEQKRYKGLIKNSMIFSPDSQHFGYIAVNYEDAFVIVIDGTEYRTNAKWAGKLCFSPDSKHFAYIVNDESRWSVVVDGEPGKYYPNLIVDERKTLFNEDRSFHYLAMRDNKIYLVEEEIVPTSQR